VVWQETPATSHHASFLVLPQVREVSTRIYEGAAGGRMLMVIDRDADLRLEMRVYLGTLTITRDNIGEIRRSLFMPWDSAWNGWVRDETAAREKNKSPTGSETD
jgi:hypothetical protein